ncbi:hypothetical protein EON73_01305 [bacterium]|nr:MAG: hypothetical protein EON73_01305 [bacterium]
MFRIQVLSQEAKPGAPLSPILGQQQIKVSDFVLKFNQQSKDYINGFPLTCRVYKLSSTQFEIKVCPPSLSVLFYSCANNKIISISDFYFILNYRFQSLVSPSIVKTAKGTLRSLTYQIQ